MKLTPLLNKKRLTLLGLNSGTSADGLDLSVVRVDRSGGGYRIKVLAGGGRKYPRKLRQAVLDLADNAQADLESAILLDCALGQFCGRSAASFLKRFERQGIKIDAIASHGQTVRHLPQTRKLSGYRVRGSLQLGSPEQIAAITGKTVISDFRQADIATGGEGAPITGQAMGRMFGHRTKARLIVNIGGMSNFFGIPASDSCENVRVADCGPGNSLSDLLSHKFFDRAYDRGGRQALKGKVSRRLLTLLLAEPFFARGAASTGREAFGVDLVARLIAAGRRLKLTRADIFTTAAELTPVVIARQVQKLLAKDGSIDKLYLTGGGARNRFFVRRISELLDGLAVGSVAELGFDPDLVEATAFAVMGEACLRSESQSAPPRGRKTIHPRPIPGRIVQPPAKG